MSQSVPQIDNRSRLAKWLGRWARRSSEKPLPVLVVSLFITLVCIWLATTQLSFRTSRLDLLSPTSNYNQRWLRYLDKFGREDDAVFVVLGDNPEHVAAALRVLGPRLSRDQRLPNVLYERHLGTLTSKAMYLLPTPFITNVAQLLSNCGEFFHALDDHRSAASLTLPESSNAPGSPSSVVTANAPTVASSLLAGLHHAQFGLQQLASRFPRFGELILEDHGKMGLCLVRMPHPDDDPHRSLEILNSLTDHLGKIRREFPQVEFGLTGMPVLEWDESLASQLDMQRATYFSLAGVAIVFVIGFGSWRLPLCAIVCLAISLIWTVGLAALVLGHLNLFSIAFGAILAGLGIDYAIHVLTRFQSLVHEDATISLPQAFETSIAHCGCGIVSGALTTAVAFIAAVFTPFRGIAELGIITAIGVIVCMAVTLIVLPAIVGWQSSQFLASKKGLRSHWLTVSSGPRWLSQSMSTVNWLAIASPRTSLFACGVFTIACGWFARSTFYDHNLLNLQAADAKSVQVEHELIRRSGPSTWFAVSVADSPRQARMLRERFLKLPTVARVEEVGSLVEVPMDLSTRAQLVEYCRTTADALASHSQLAAFTSAEKQRTNFAVTPATYAANSLGHFFPAEMFSSLNSLSQSITQMSVGAPPQITDLPEPVQSRMVSHDHSAFLLRIFAKDDIWQRENLELFVRELERVDPKVTGHPVQTYYASAELQNSYLHAGLYALLLVLALLMLDLGSVRLVLIAMIPVMLSGLQLLGILGWLGIPFNAANMIVLPLIIGIGIDDGIHIVHEFKRASPRFQLSSASSASILLTSATTMIGFGCIAFSDHRGLQSLGIVLVLGVGLCLVNSLLVLPPVLVFVSKFMTVATAPSQNTTLAVHPIRTYLLELGITHSAAPQILSLPQCSSEKPPTGPA